MTPTLRRYLDLERSMLALDALDAEAADAVRDVMDAAWYALSEADRVRLDERTVPGRLLVFEQVRLPVTQSLFHDPPALEQRLPCGGQPVTGWRGAA